MRTTDITQLNSAAAPAETDQILANVSINQQMATRTFTVRQLLTQTTLPSHLIKTSSNTITGAITELGGVVESDVTAAEIEAIFRND